MAANTAADGTFTGQPWNAIPLTGAIVAGNLFAYGFDTRGGQFDPTTTEIQARVRGLVPGSAVVQHVTDVGFVVGTFGVAGAATALPHVITFKRKR